MKILVVLSILCLGWSCSSLPEEVEVISGIELKETADYISLTPSNASLKTTGFMFYSGALVAPQGYIPLLQEIAVLGYQVVIVKTTANLAIFNRGKAIECVAEFPAVGQWVIGGHSLGGVVATMDVYTDVERFKGLVLLATYPSKQQDLSTWKGAVLSIHAENDSLSSPREIIETEYLLPPKIEVEELSQMPSSSTFGQSVFHQIKGGNHSQYGDYGEQDGDGIPAISRRQQQEEIVNYILSFFNANNW